MKSLIIIICLLMASPVFAGKVDLLSWKSSVADDLKGYTATCGTFAKDTDKATTTLLLTDILNAEDGAYSCSVIAFDYAGNKSKPSNTVEVLKSEGNFFNLEDTTAPPTPGNFKLQ